MGGRARRRRSGFRRQRPISRRVVLAVAVCQLSGDHPPHLRRRYQTLAFSTSSTSACCRMNRHRARCRSSASTRQPPCRAGVIGVGGHRVSPPRPAPMRVFGADPGSGEHAAARSCLVANVLDLGCSNESLSFRRVLQSPLRLTYLPPAVRRWYRRPRINCGQRPRATMTGT